jgi:hypothetical protein
MKIDLEWLDAPSVTDPGEGATWAQITFTVGPHCLTELHDPRTNSVRRGYHGSALPLAEWVARELLVFVAESQALTRNEEHHFRVARAGGAMPDLVARRVDDETIGLELLPDSQLPGIAVRFINAGRYRFQATDFDQALRAFLSVVEQRLGTRLWRLPDSR